MRSFNSVALLARARIAVRLTFAAYQTYKRVYHPFVDLGIRLAIAQAFLHSGLVKVLDWQNALALARYEYPVSWMTPEHAAITGIVIELICPLLLALGLFTRLAALPMAVLALVIQANYATLDTNLFLAATLFSYVVFGARALSLDALITPGLADSALPLVPQLVKSTAVFTATTGPVFQLLLRIWLAWTLLRLPAPPAIFPTASAHDLLPSPFSIAGGLLLGLGLGATVINKVLAGVVLGVR